MKYYLYILKSKTSDKYYTGISEDVERRLEFHNTREKGFTSRYRPWEVVFKKEFENKAEAIRAERNVKRWKSKLMIEKLIKQEIEIPE
ncbi:MAG: GIY-YIG nuclease family protein [Ignavibacterium album]|uniref:GIY-YIG nuclease family protein n=1 Tax=Ignavibacterium album TaxID=591197 RepID=UPI0026E9BF97|nr:GIY-YIG nuclease family protein [Ignavibacterium album]MBI5662604.1 GIY-YIG nuclease family protein [Ignavibacterium album]